MMQDAKKATQKEVVSEIDARIAKRQCAAEGFRMKELPHPQRYRTQILLS
jgi:hypothetical protein